MYVLLLLHIITTVYISITVLLYIIIIIGLEP